MQFTTKNNTHHNHNSLHLCIVNSYLIDDDILALCDCNNGCFNYRIENGIPRELQHIPINDKIYVMKEVYYENGVTMSVVSETSIRMFRWSPI